MTPCAADTFPAALARANQANDELIAGRSALLMELFSHRDDATVLGGFGGHERGWSLIGSRLQWVGGTFLGGHCEYEVLTSWAGADLGYVVQIERIEARVVGRAEPLRVALRVTMVFRREDGEWKLLHRHADDLAETKATS
jgi:ketosteroid isomerase-like protein